MHLKRGKEITKLPKNCKTAPEYCGNDFAKFETIVDFTSKSCLFINYIKMLIHVITIPIKNFLEINDTCGKTFVVFVMNTHLSMVSRRQLEASTLPAVTVGRRRPQRYSYLSWKRGIVHIFEKNYSMLCELRKLRHHLPKTHFDSK